MSKRPAQPDSYVGIGMTVKEDLSADEYMGKAKNSALFDLASEIMVGISGEFVLEMTECTGMTEEEVQAEMKSVASASLTGHEIADTWDDRKEYWVFYSLSKREYQSMIEQKKRQAFEAAAAMKKKAAAESKQGDIPTAMRFYLRALGAMQEVMAHPPTAGDRSRNPLLEVEDIYATLQKSLKEFEISALTTSAYGLVGAPVDSPLSVRVTLAGKPVSGLPVRFAFTSGGGQLSGSVQTDENGIARSHVTSVTSDDALQTIRATVDTAGLASIDRTNVFFKCVVGRLASPETVVEMKVFPGDKKDEYLWTREFDGKKIAVLTACETDGEAGDWDKMGDEIAAFLREHGARVTHVSADADDIVGAARNEPEDWPVPEKVKADAVVLAVAKGKIKKRSNDKSPEGEDSAFTGKISFHVSSGGKRVYSDDFSGTGGWNPMGERMCMDILALNVSKRWKARHAKQMAEGL